MYLFYIDESGQREYESGSQYFALCAVGVPIEEWQIINADVLALKKTYFGDVEVEIKSNWLRNPKEQQKHYTSRYPVTQAELLELANKLYDILLSHNVVIFASVVDKHQMQAQYTEPQSPNSLAYRHIFERIELFLQHQAKTHGILIFDKITEAEISKKGYENLLARQHLRYLEKGTDFVRVSQIAEGLLFIPSHENNLLQLADLCAYNVYRQFVDHGAEWDVQGTFTSRYSYFERIEPKIHCRPAGGYAGWGLQKFP